ncbi:MAG: hypothetical protein KAQ87_01910 [Candidatus Pacebacteria bacterium]|nr:hypothetical protein [Candidatus Paceibacterota bacterium]
MTEQKISKPWYEKYWKIILAIFFGIVIVIIFSGEDKTNQSENDNLQKQEAKKVGQEEPEIIHVIFDIPALLDKNISYFASAFGKPVNENPEPTDVAIQTNVDTWVKVFEKDGYAISVTYNIDSNKVTKIFLSKGTYDMPLEETWIKQEETSKILTVGNLSKDAKNYYIRFFWPIQDKNMYTGAEIKREPFYGFNGKQLCSGYPDC